MTNHNVEVLLMYRKSTNSWHLPKGTQIVGETLEQTALREVKEETGFDIQLEKYIGKVDSLFDRNGISIQKETHYFLAHTVGGNSDNHDHEHDEITFVDYNTALSHLENFSLHEKEGKILKMAETFFV